MENKHYVYLMQSGKYYKIGVSSNPERRLRELRVGNPHLVLLYVSRPMTERTAYMKEKNYHLSLRKEHIFGEWFELKPHHIRKLMGQSNLRRDIARIVFLGAILIGYLAILSMFI